MKLYLRTEHFGRIYNCHQQRSRCEKYDFKLIIIINSLIFPSAWMSVSKINIIDWIAVLFMMIVALFLASCPWCHCASHLVFQEKYKWYVFNKNAFAQVSSKNCLDSNLDGLTINRKIKETFIFNFGNFALLKIKKTNLRKTQVGMSFRNRYSRNWRASCLMVVFRFLVCLFLATFMFKTI